MPPKSKKCKVRIQKEAVREIDRIVGWMAEKSLRVADGFLSGLKEKIMNLSTYPHRGARARLLEAKEEAPIIRWIEFKKYLIFYAVDDRKVTILHVTPPGQDWMKLFI